MRVSPSVWLRRTLGLWALLPVFVCTSPAHAQAPGDPAKHYTKETTFHLPIRIEDKARPTIREVQLWVKTPLGDWMKRDQAPPTQSSFKFKAPQDGEYWFTLVTIDVKTNQATPGDLSRLAPDDIVVVVVDTQPPAFDLQPMKVASGDLMLKCTISDANPDYKAIKITYAGSNQIVQVLEPAGGQSGMFRVPSPEIFLAPVRVSVTDLAGNTTTREVNLQELPGGAPQVVKQEPAKLPQEVVKQPQDVVKQPTGPAVSNPPPTGIVQTGAVGSNVSSGVGVIQSNANVPTPPQPPINAEPKPGLPTPGALPPSVNRQLLNTTRASLDYRIDQVGPSGVGKVEVWMTADQGLSWKRLCEDMDRRSPAEFDLPGDGLYGLRVAVANGNGFGGRAPQPGEQPHCWIEVDTVPPVVQLRDVEPVSNGSTIDIRWLASDKNLSAEPINLYYATRKEGPWLPVATKLKNDGVYRWTFPRDGGGQFFLRAEATDLAGNVARCESPTAIVLDMTEPRASVVGVTGRQ